MYRKLIKHLAATLAIAAAMILSPAAAQASSPGLGIVIMHGKGGSPVRHVADLSSSLEGKGYLVANLEMPWSGQRGYDASVADAEGEVRAALDALRARGATSLFVAGHSQGGLFALRFGGQHPVDGIVAIAPGGNVGNAAFRTKLGDSVDKARRLVAEGKGEERSRFLDFEGAKGLSPVVASAAIYLGWFDPDGAMNQAIAAQNVKKETPVLLIVPKSDYPGLLRAKQPTFDALPRHPLTRLHEPDSDHLGAPSASIDEIVRWTREVHDAKAR